MVIGRPAVRASKRTRPRCPKRSRPCSGSRRTPAVPGREPKGLPDALAARVESLHAVPCVVAFLSFSGGIVPARSGPVCALPSEPIASR